MLSERLGKKRPGVKDRIDRSEFNQLSRTQVLMFRELCVHPIPPAELSVEDMNREFLGMSFMKLWKKRDRNREADCRIVPLNDFDQGEGIPWPEKPHDGQV